MKLSYKDADIIFKMIIAICLLSVFWAILKVARPIENKQMQMVKQANGRSVVLKQEKIGDGRQPMIVTHYGRLAETGEVTYWTEVHYETIRFNRQGERVR